MPISFANFLFSADREKWNWDFVTIRLIICLMESRHFNKKKKSVCTIIICAYNIEWPGNI